MHLSNRKSFGVVLCALLNVAACSEQTNPKIADSTAKPPAANASDSPYTGANMVARFRKTVPEHPTEFGGGATNNRDSLVAHFVKALAANDTAAYAALRMSVSEFAWLYYLEVPQSRPPYELDPDVLWMQMTAQSNKGLGRLAERVKSKPFGFKSLTCEPPETQGALRIHRCEMTGAELTIPLSIVERNGRFKFTGFANRL